VGGEESVIICGLIPLGGIEPHIIQPVAMSVLSVWSLPRVFCYITLPLVLWIWFERACELSGTQFLFTFFPFFSFFLFFFFLSFFFFL